MHVNGLRLGTVHAMTWLSAHACCFGASHPVATPMRLRCRNRVGYCRMRFKRGDFKVDERGARMALVHDGVLVTDSQHLLVFNSTRRMGDLQGSIIQDELAKLARCSCYPACFLDLVVACML